MMKGAGMKKFIFACGILFLGVLASAEELKFITTLSQPQGSFARVESSNAERPARALQVNFCNNKVSSGQINVDGAVRAAYLQLDNTGSLGGNVPVYQLSRLNLGGGKTFEGGNVWADETNPARVKADGTLYGRDMSYLVAELPALKITNTANIKRGGPTGEDMEWGAQFPCDYKDANGAISCAGAEKYDSYLLKSKGGTMREPTVSCADQTYKLAHKSECCASAAKTDADCWKLDWELYYSGGGNCEGAGCGSSSDDCTLPCNEGDHCEYVEAEPEAGVVNWGSGTCTYFKNGW